MEDYSRCIIFHIDVNSAFLSWSALKVLEEDPTAQDLRLIPSAVGGDKATRHGIITAKSIPAKKYGIVTGEPVVKALQKCPELVLVPSDFSFYKAKSNAFMEILRSYAPVVEQASIDEAYLDFTGTEKLYGDLATAEHPFPICLGYKIKDEILERLGFTVNVGISTNKLLAKMASDFTKPNKVHTLYPEEVPSKMWPLDIGDLFGCGKATAERLRSLGIRTIGDAAGTDPQILMQLLGEKGGAYIYRSANGLSDSAVTPDRGDAKSYSNEITTAEDITAENYAAKVPGIIRNLSDHVASRLRRDGVYAGTINVSVKTGAFKRRSRQMAVLEPTNSGDEIYKTAMHLIDELCLGESGLLIKGDTLRLIGVGTSNLDHGEYRQLSLFDLGRALPQRMSEPTRKVMQEVGREADAENTGAYKMASADREAGMIKESARFGDAATAPSIQHSREKDDRLGAMLDKINASYGKNTIVRASAMEGHKIAKGEAPRQSDLHENAEKNR